MPITLKHINISDSDQIKLDKVNYNFDQLVANGGGPTGPQGSIGQDGPQGTTGVQGFQGVIGDEGFQGSEGPISENYWKQIIPDTHIDADRLVPIHTSGDQFAPVVNIGYIENDSQYGTKLPLVSGKTPYQWNIYRRQYSISNLRFLNDNDFTIAGNGYDFRLEKLAGKDQMTFGFINPENSISTYRGTISSFRSSAASYPGLIISDTAASFALDTIFNSPVVIKRRLIIQNANADTDKIAISEDNTGLVKFKSVQELGGTVPYGTIVSILPSVFLDNNNFINTETVYPGFYSAVQISVGKGVGFYEGWYLCHGYEWTDGTTLGTYPVPMLGNFNYYIDDNPFTTDPSSQGSATTSNFRTHITGGSDIDMTATAVPTLVYNITSTVSTSTVQVDPGTGTTFKVKQLPQIIYLGRNDLFWQDLGTGQAPSVPLTLLLDDTNPDAGERLSPDPYTLDNITNQPAGASYSFVTTITTPAGYHWSTTPSTGDFINVPGYATIQSVTLGSGTFPTTIQVGISINPHPSTLTTDTLSIDTSSFISPTSATILLQRSNPSNTTVNLGTSYNISYNFTTGYSFTLICTADFYYEFTSTSTTINSLVGGGTYTINNSTLTSDIFGPNRVLTLDITITGVAVGITSLLYSLTLPIVSTRPTLSSVPTNSFYISGTGNVAPPNRPYTSYTVAVTNNTANSNIYVWVGINQFGGVSSTGNTNASITGNWGGLSVTAPPVPVGNTGSNYYYSPTYYTISNVPGSNVLNAALSSPATSDSYHEIRLYWATSPGGTKTAIPY